MSYLMPLTKPIITSNYKSKNYKTQFGFEHYGIDMTAIDGNIYSSGNGKILKKGNDSILGNFIVAQYDNLFIVRYFHLASYTNITVLTPTTILGIYGNTGIYSTGAHLHIEIDFDLQYPYYTPTLSGKSSNFIGSNFNANDNTMIDPLTFLKAR